MRLLDRYLLRELLIPFSYCLVGFMVFWVSCDLVMQLADYQKLKLTAGDVLTYYAIRLPEILVLILPIAFLLALLYALTNHARHHEITAIRAAGVGLFRLAMPYLVVGVLLSGVVLAINELWVPQSLEAAEAVLARHKPDRVDPDQHTTEDKLGFYNALERRWWFIESYDLTSGGMRKPHVIWIPPPDGPRTEILAEGAEYAESTWVFTNGYRLVYPPTTNGVPEQQPFESLTMALFKETPEQIRSEIKISKLNRFKEIRKVQLSIREIMEYKKLHPGDHSKSAMLETKLQGRWAAPWTCLVVVLIALPFGAASGRRNVLAGVASSIVICFSYFILAQLSLALGTGGRVAPWLAAWAPNGFFGLAGLLMTLRVR
ncbi:MAG TPA: LptF/LptG family permease [Verrucomicrobiae bacterium]|nr:LptF/LptG family permease [Verrucomicrobiae bacterium]